MLEPLFESFLETSPDAFVGFEPSGSIVVANRPAQELLGYDRAALVGQPIESILPALSPPALVATPPLAASGSGLRLVLEARRSGGATLPVELTLVPIEAEAGPLIFGRLNNLGVTGKEVLLSRREVEARRIKKRTAIMRDEFLATLAHELRMPLQSILGWTQLMRDKPRDHETTAHALDVIERNIRRQARVIYDLIDLAEILYGHLRLEVRPVRVAPIIDAAFERVSEVAQSKGVQYIRDLDAEETEILADPNRLEQVIWKLLHNAFKFTPEGGRVELRSQVVGPLTQISVRDTGQGIDPALLPRLFDSAHANEVPSQNQWPGLGLSIVRNLVELQGGSIHVESAGVGRGASFTISLPVAGVS